MGLLEVLNGVANVATVAQPVLNMLGLSSQNSTNLQIAREANEQQYKMFRESQEWQNTQRELQNDYASMMWREQNEYNSPANQAALYRAAGLNPALAIGSDSTAASVSSAGSSGSSPSAPTPLVPNYQSPLVNAGFDRSAIALSDIAHKYSVTKGQTIDNETKGAKNLRDISESLAREKSLLANKDLTVVKKRETLKNIDILEHTRQKLMFEVGRQSTLAAQMDETFRKMMRQYDDNHEAAIQATRINDLMAQLAIKRDTREYAQLQNDITKLAYELRVMGATANDLNASAVIKAAQTAGVKLDNMAKIPEVKHALKESKLLDDKGSNIILGMARLLQKYLNPFSGMIDKLR